VLFALLLPPTNIWKFLMSCCHLFDNFWWLLFQMINQFVTTCHWFQIEIPMRVDSEFDNLTSLPLTVPMFWLASWKVSQQKMYQNVVQKMSKLYHKLSKSNGNGMTHICNSVKLYPNSGRLWILSLAMPGQLIYNKKHPNSQKTTFDLMWDCCTGQFSSHHIK